MPRRPWPAARARQRGFSLLEIIAAVLILAVAFTALMELAGGSMNLTARAAERSQAALWARSLLDSAFVLDPIRTGHTEGRFDDRYRWRLAVTPWTPPDAAPDANQGMLRLYRLDLDVLWGPTAHERIAHFSTLRAVGRTYGANGS